MTPASLAYMDRVGRVARVIQDHAQKIGSHPVEAAESMQPRTWQEAFTAAGVTFMPSMIGDVILALREHGGGRASDPNAIPTDILRPSAGAVR